MEISVRLVPNTKTQSGLKRIPDRVIWNVARDTLDKARSTEIIPMSPPGTKTRGRLRSTSMAGGVRGSNGNYYIGSYTGYASHVWNMPDSTNWTTSGTNNKWYTRTLQRHGATIINNAINKGWRDVM